jgi:hypothetical protein
MLAGLPLRPASRGAPWPTATLPGHGHRRPTSAPIGGIDQYTPK